MARTVKSWTVGDRVLDPNTKCKGVVESVRKVLGVQSVVVKQEGKSAPVAYIGAQAEALKAVGR